MAFTGFVVGGTNVPALRDNFNRADSSPPGLSWNVPLFTGEATAQVFSVQLERNDPGPSGGTYWGSDEASADMAMAAIFSLFTSTGSGANCSLYTRIPSAALPMDGGADEDAWRVAAVRVTGATNDELRCYQIVDGIHTSLTPSSGAINIATDWTNGDMFGFTMRETGGQTEIQTWWRRPPAGWSTAATFLSSTAGRRTTLGRSAVEFNTSSDGANTVTIGSLWVEDYAPSTGSQRPNVRHAPGTGLW